MPWAIYIKERVEEWRSRISFMESTLIQLEYAFKAVSSEAIQNNQAPPFLHPKNTFKLLKKGINECKKSLDTIKEDIGIYNIISIFDKLFYITKKIFNEIIRLQNLFGQRTSVMGTMNLFEFTPIEQSENGRSLKTYNAVDALSSNLVQVILGKGWAKKVEYTPISLFDSNGYSINPESHIISIPFHDAYRSRFWAALSHEIAHIFLRLNAEGLLKIVIEEYVESLSDIVFYKNRARFQIIELACDIISVLTCPGAYFSGASMFPLQAQLETKSKILRNWRLSYHPPVDIRLETMDTILDNAGIKEQSDPFSRFINDVNYSIKVKNLTLDEEKFRFLGNYSAIMANFTSDFSKRLNLFTIERYTPNKFKKVQKALEQSNYTNLDPIDIIQLLWLKRLEVFYSEGEELKLTKFLQNRIYEPNMFENAVECMHNYYLKNIQEEK